MWQCRNRSPPPNLRNRLRSRELWEAAMRSYDPALQEAILRWAEVVEEAYRE